VAELVERTKQEPGRIHFGSGGVGSTPHMAGELFALSNGIHMSHIAYKGEQSALTDVIGNQIPVMFSNFQVSWPLVQSGRLRALAISSGTRSPVAPDIPTIAETVSPGFDAATWFGVVAPRATPRAIIAQLGIEIAKAARDARFRQPLQERGMSIQALDPTAFDAYIADEYLKWRRVIRQARITTQ